MCSQSLQHSFDISAFPEATCTFMKYLGCYTLVSTLLFSPFYALYAQSAQTCSFDGVTGSCTTSELCTTYIFTGVTDCASNV